MSSLAVPAKKKPSIPPWATLASGATSGLASCVLLQPMDLLKTRLQQQQQHQPQLPAAESAAGSRSKPSGSRLSRTIKLVVQTDGVSGLWRGTTPTIIRNVPGVALYFWSVTELRAFLARSSIPVLSPARNSALSALGSGSGVGSSSTLPKLGTPGNLVSGAVARVTVGFILCPVTVIKTRYEDAYPSILGSFRSIYRTSGIRGLYSGFTATALRDAPYAGIYLALYEGFKSALGRARERADEAAYLLRRTALIGEGSPVPERLPPQQTDWLITSSSGLLAGTLATVITHPFDVLKTRIQIRVDPPLLPPSASASNPISSLTAAAAAASRRPGIVATARSIGLRGLLLDGLGLRCLRKGLSGAIGWTVFEAGRGLWVRKNS
ncbi:unnamed protein product [Tilletia caries]|uniref:Mitochondrial glycine transporter n=1 Tax=Tilletia caries TaxID=13290 RepID=A0ABN7J7F8_9BASI|nr:unnamed protein product [Tilletia caries]CAD6957048.1 unnamed protein product [Tilletia caries]